MKLLAVVCLIGSTLASNQITRARAYIYKAVKGGVPQENVGIIDFTQNGNSLTVNGTLFASLQLAPGLHGFHVHDKGDLGNGCLDTGGHYNPHKMNHGASTDSNRHIGDLGNIQSPNSGDTQILVADTLASLNGPYSIIGRGVVVHEKADDLGRGGAELSLTTGNAGGRLACGVIGIIDEVYVTSTVPTSFFDPTPAPKSAVSDCSCCFLLLLATLTLLSFE